ncbi:MAG: hypothetical protein ACLQCB_17990 [Spirochaetia bacterium]
MPVLLESPILFQILEAALILCRNLRGFTHVAARPRIPIGDLEREVPLPRFQTLDLPGDFLGVCLLPELYTFQEPERIAKKPYSKYENLKYLRSRDKSSDNCGLG